MVDSNKEHGEGRSDVVVYDSLNGRVAVFEAKYAKSLNDLETPHVKKLCSRWMISCMPNPLKMIMMKSFVMGFHSIKKRCVVKKKIIQIISCKNTSEKEKTPDPADEACSGVSLQIYPYPHSRNKFLSYFCNLFGNQLHLVSNYPSNNNKAHIPALPMPLLQNFHKAHLYKCQDFYLHGKSICDSSSRLATNNPVSEIYTLYLLSSTFPFNGNSGNCKHSHTLISPASFNHSTHPI